MPLNVTSPFYCSDFLRVVVQRSPSLSIGQLVCVTQYYPTVDGVPRIGPALAVGHMALRGDQIGGPGKGKAVNIVHTWKDHLWEMGGKEDPPAPRVAELNRETGSEAGGEGPPISNPDPPAEITPGSSGEGSPQLRGEPLATPPEEEANRLSQQGTALGFLEIFS